MKQCPRCGYKITDEDKYCPHCGLDLQRQYKPLKKKTTKATNYLLYALILFSFISVPLLYSQFLNNFSQNIPLTQQIQNSTLLPDIIEAEPTALFQSFDTLADYKKEYSNVSSFVTNIENFEKTLSQKGEYTFEKEYSIQVLNNYNVLYRLVYTTMISDQYEIKIIKEYDRAHSYNREITSLRKIKAETFEDLLLNDKEKEMINHFINDRTTIDQLIQTYSLRKDEFNAKKEKLGHYGLGTYQDNASFVVYRYGETYQSELKYQIESKDYMG